MITAFLTTLEQMGKILLYLALGFGLNRLHILPKGAGAGVSRLITMVFMPALLIHSNMTEFNLTNVGQYSQLVLFGALFMAVAILVAYPIAGRFAARNSQQYGVYLYGLTFPNTGAVGTPLVMAIMGSAGYFQYNIFLLVFTVMTYAWGVGLFLNTDRKNPVKRFFINMLNPIFVSMFIGIVLGAVGAKNWMPSLATGLLKDLGACYVPVSLLLTGYTVADYPLGEVFNRPKSYVFALFRLILIPLVMLMLAWVLKIPSSIAALVAFTFSGPSGMNVVVFPASYGQDCRSGASIVLISSLGSILTVPIIYTLVHLLFA